MAAKPKIFDRKTLQSAFQRLGELASADGKVIEISVYRGSALVLTTDFRVGTQDVDAVFEADRGFVRAAAHKIAEEFGWDDNWINDGVKGFLSAQDSAPEAKSLFRSYPSETGPGLRVFVASPSYLFAMKCLAMRASGVERSADVEDIRRLGAMLGIGSAEQAIAAVMRYYPSGRLPPKTRFGLEEIFGGTGLES
ncbi:MAG: hypothetical protein JO261_04080 [Alphaproteobacteria bacterium]|nr:hypothetical protein [Alphaproteobacteria bacterium]MBV9692859.1 hypothetical protein [Alphaproteobacteria bacterium]